MKIFDRLFRAIGFDEEENNEEENLDCESCVKKENKANAYLLSAKFNLKEKKHEIHTYYPQSQQDVNDIVKIYAKGEELILNLENLEIESKEHILDFVSGAVFALEGEISKLEENLYLLRH